MPIEPEIFSRLGNIEGKIDILLGDRKPTNDRISSVEKKQWLFSGALALAMALFGFLR